MTTPPPPPPGGNPPSGGTQGLTSAIRHLTMQLQALMHRNQTLTNLPSSATSALRQARQNVLNPQALLGGQVPPPAVPNQAWLHQTAASFLSQVVLNQPRPVTGRGTGGGGGGGGGGTPPTGATPPGPTPPSVPPYPQGSPYHGPAPGPFPSPLVSPTHPGGGGQHSSTGIGSWTRSMMPALAGARFGPWGAVAGAAVAAATQVPAEVRSQRDKNAYYQSIEGGDNFSGFGERISEEVYRWSTPMVLSSDEARNSFKGVTRLGYNSKVEDGIGRQEALNYVYHGKTRRGQTVEEGLQQLQVNSKNALGSLKDLNDALNAVSDSAGKAGINAQMARAEFVQTMDQAIKQGYGSSASGVAALEQNIKSSYGRSFQDVDASGRMGDTRAYLAASMTGMSVSEYMLAGPTAKGQADAVVDMSVARMGLKPGVEAWIKEQIAKAGGNVSEEVEQQIAEEMLLNFYPNDGKALVAVVNSLSGYNVGNDPVKAAAWIVKQFNGKGAKAEVKELTKKEKAEQTKASEKNQVDTTTPAQRARMSHHDPRRLGSLDREHSGGFLGIGGSNSKAYEAYQEWRDKNDGHQDPVIHNLLNKIDGDDKTKVAVSTKDGKKVVPLADAIKRHRNELASGKAVILPEKGKAKTVEELLGKDKVDPLRDFSKEAKAKEKAGESYASWEKDHTVKDKKSGREKLEIGLTAEARRILTVMDSSGVAGASATATPPLSPFASNPSHGGE